MDQIQLKKIELRLLQEKLKLQEMLPHRYSLPWYEWAYRFYNCTDKKMQFLCAGNQISKSTTMQRKMIEWATNDELWPKLWPNQLSTPNVFWYLYPTRDVAEAEWQAKIKPLMPKDQDHPVYGWKEMRSRGAIDHIIFKNKGHELRVYFKSYSQSVTDLQTGTVYAIFCDEELPVNLLPELSARLNATSGYFHMAFTATLGQELWRKTIEPQTPNEELYPDALKIQVDLERGDCSYYIDGTPSPWTPEKIQEAINRCSSPQEKARRINGRFVVEGGLRFSSFEKERNVVPAHPIPRNWLVFAGLDYGSGGENHPSAITFVGVSPDYRKARVFLGKRFDYQVTTCDDVIRQYADMKKGLNVVVGSYDYSATDLYTIASGLGIPLTKADKNRERGTEVLNTLFKTGVLKIFDDPELAKLVAELLSLKSVVNKSDAIDDFCDSLRYAVMSVPWDWGYLEDIAKLDQTPIESDKIEYVEPKETDLRREWMFERDDRQEWTPERELQEWDDMLNGELEF